MELDGQLMQKQLHSTPMAVDDSRRFPVGCISNDFDVNDFEWEEEEQEEDDRISDVVSSDSDDFDDDQGGTDTMPTRLMPCQYRFILCHYQYQLRFCKVSMLRID